MKWRTLIMVIIGAFGLLLATATFFLQDSIFRLTINPRIPYEIYVPPTAPDYTDRKAWAMWPENSAQHNVQGKGDVDVFYVHSTTYRGRAHWNAPIHDHDANQLLMSRALPNEVGPFGHLGAVYAPRYRQATLFSFFTIKHKGRAARLTAYEDVYRAFEIYLKNRVKDRPIILVGYGQGGLHVQGLLADYFQNNEALQRHLVAAYIIDHPTTTEMLRTTHRQTPACANANDIRCIISWAAYEPKFSDKAERIRRRSFTLAQNRNLSSTEDQNILCTNPITWQIGSQATEQYQHKGAASATGIPYGESPAIIEQVVSTKCDNGIVLHSEPEQQYLRRQKRFGRSWLPLSFNLFYEDIRVNVEGRIALTRAALDRENAIAPPMMEAIDMQESPIRKVPK